MENKYINLSSENLKSILIKLNKQKITRHHKNKIFNVDKILSINTKKCLYTGNKNEYKTHLQVKYTSTDENGIICLSVLLDKYNHSQS